MPVRSSDHTTETTKTAFGGVLSGFAGRLNIP